MSQSAVGNDFLFTGRDYDAETGLYYYRARTMHPGLGRFMQKDPLLYVDGYNSYIYVLDNPLLYVDAFGLDGMIIGGGGNPGNFDQDPDQFTRDKKRYPYKPTKPTKPIKPPKPNSIFKIGGRMMVAGALATLAAGASLAADVLLTMPQLPAGSADESAVRYCLDKNYHYIGSCPIDDDECLCPKDDECEK